MPKTLGDVAPRNEDWFVRELKKVQDELKQLRSARVGNTMAPVPFYEADFDVAESGVMTTVISAHIDVPAGFRTAVIVATATWYGLRPAADPGTYTLTIQTYLGEDGEFSPQSLYGGYPDGSSSPEFLQQTLSTTLTGAALSPDLVVGALAAATGPWETLNASISGIVLFLR